MFTKKIGKKKSDAQSIYPVLLVRGGFGSCV